MVKASKEDICDLSTEGQNQTISTFETITNVTGKEIAWNWSLLAKRPEKVEAKAMSKRCSAVGRDHRGTSTLLGLEWTHTVSKMNISVRTVSEGV